MTSESNRTPNQHNDSQIEADLKLVKSITGGSTAAWHEFLNRYSGLIYGVVRRHLFAEDEDDVRTVYVDILKSLYDGEINRYKGNAHLSTWLIVSTRSRTIDFFRKRHGRYRMPEGYNKLNEFDKKVFRLFFVEKLSLEIVVHTLDWSGYPAKIDDIVKSIMRIENTVDLGSLKRFDNEYYAKKYGVDSVRVLKYLIQLRMEREERSLQNRTDTFLDEREILETAGRLRNLISDLTPKERELIYLRFDRGWSAGKIAKKLKLKNQRSAYSLIDKAVKKLREALTAGEDG